MSRKLLIPFIAAAIAVVAPVAAQAPPQSAQPALHSEKLTLTVGAKKHHYNVEIAATPGQQEIGLMFRRTMARDHGMIFPFQPARPASFWMENTVLPLDLIFIAPDRTVGRIAADARPFSRDVIASGGPVIAVLELNAGEAARIGLRPGDKVEFAGM